MNASEFNPRVILNEVKDLVFVIGIQDEILR